jgi:hypothetical protein
MKKPQRLSRAEIEREVEQAWQQMLENNGSFEWNPTSVEKTLKQTNVPRETRVVQGLTMGAALGLGGMGKNLASHIKTREQLEEILREIRKCGEMMPTILRKATKQMIGTLPRRGGPGRRPKLDRKEASQMCDQIALFIRQKYSLKQALQKVSELSPSILSGKKVSPRTLQKAWGRRDEFGTG